MSICLLNEKIYWFNIKYRNRLTIRKLINHLSITFHLSIHFYTSFAKGCCHPQKLYYNWRISFLINVLPYYKWYWLEQSDISYSTECKITYTKFHYRFGRAESFCSGVGDWRLGHHQDLIFKIVDVIRNEFYCSN